MKPFSENAVCPKCGSELIRTKYDRDARFRFKGDVIKRRCERCDYVWSELPLDAVGEK